MSPIIRMPAEECSARALGGVFGSKSQEEVEAEEVWNLGSVALMREDTISPNSTSPRAAGVGVGAGAGTAAAAAAAAGEKSGGGGGGDALGAALSAAMKTAAAGDEAAVAATVPATTTTTGAKLVSSLEEVDRRGGDSGGDSGSVGGGSGSGSVGGSDGGGERRGSRTDWREVRDKALAANGGSFTSSRRSSPILASPKVEFKRRCVSAVNSFRNKICNRSGMYKIPFQTWFMSIPMGVNRSERTKPSVPIPLCC